MTYISTPESEAFFKAFNDGDNIYLTGNAGCVDSDTEFMTRTGWKKISDWSGEEILILDENSIGCFQKPEYIKEKTNENFFHVKTSHLEMTLTGGHRVRFESPKFDRSILSMNACVKKLSKRKAKRSYPFGILRSFTMGSYNKGLMSEPLLRLMVAIIADGHFPKRKNKNNYCRINLKKKFKKDRLIYLLNDCGLKYKRTDKDDGFSAFTFYPPYSDKEFTEKYWSEDLSIIADEAHRWDGCISKSGSKCFFSNSKKSAEFIQYCYTACGMFSNISTTINKKTFKNEYTVVGSKQKKHGFGIKHITKQQNKTGYVYCFTTKTGLRLARKNGKIFITGNSGKSYLVNRMQKQNPEKYILKIAPTGVAAINVGGQTIHRFLGMSIGTYSRDSSFDIKVFSDIRNKHHAKPDKLMERIRSFVLVIDEISMVRSDMFDILNNSLKLSTGLADPFGGVQVVLVGDPYQLPPIEDDGRKDFLCHQYESPYFFDAPAWHEGEFKKINLTKVFRQSDQKFITLLNSIRVGRNLGVCIDILNKRVTRNKVPGCIILCSTNRKVKSYNDSEFRSLPGAVEKFTAIRKGKFPNDMIPVPYNLELKEGCQVMIKANAKDLSYVNGTLGIYEGIDEDGKMIIRESEDEEHRIGVCNRKITKPEADGDRISNVEMGSYIQYPVVLAAAITINKSQGLTFDQVYIDTDRGLFADGQGYVALSRCTSFEGIRLAKPFKLKDITVSQAVALHHQ